jgi:hypothetical protein
MAKWTGIEQSITALNRKKARLKPSQADGYTVGFSAPYALYVHEDLSKVHPVGQAKFLEEPARTKALDLATTVNQTLRNGKTIDEALLAAANQLLGFAKALVPVDTGFLRDSGYVNVK